MAGRCSGTRESSDRSSRRRNSHEFRYCQEIWPHTAWPLSLPLAPTFAGRAFDEDLLRDLPSGVDPCGENGEFHTFVHAGPIFRAPVPFRRGEVEDRGRFQYCDLE